MPHLPLILPGDDNTGALNDALRTSRVVQLGPGIHRVTNTIHVPSNTTLIGYGQATIVLDTTENVDVLLSQQTVNVQLDGVGINGQKAQKTPKVSTGRGVHFNQVARGRIRNCHIVDCWEHGIRIGGTFWTDTGDTDDMIIAHNTVRGCGHETVDGINEHGAGIWCFWRVRDTIVESNLIYDCQHSAIMVDDSSKDMTPGKEAFRIIVAKNVCNGGNPTSTFGRAITFEGTRYFTCADNIIAGWNRGIVVNDGQAGTPTGIGTITGNQILARYLGLQFSDCRDVLASGNEIEITSWASVAHAAVKIEQGMTGAALERIRLEGNRIRSNGAGISTRMTPGYLPSGAGMLDVKLIKNELWYTGPGGNNQHNGIWLGGIQRPHLERNDVVGFYDGLVLEDTCSGARLVGNTAVGCARYGMRVGPAGTFLRGNDARENGTAPYLFDSAARVPSTYVAEDNTADAVWSVDGPTFGA